MYRYLAKISDDLNETIAIVVREQLPLSPEITVQREEWLAAPQIGQKQRI